MLKKFAGFIIIVLVAIVLAATGFAWYINQPPVFSEDKISFTISAGEKLSSIAASLENKGLIRSGFFLRVYARIRGTEQDFRQGNYAFKRSMTTVQIHDLIVSGKQIDVRITVPEGFTISQIAKIMNEKHICSANDFLKAAADPKILRAAGIDGATAEGYLFPDTYLFPEDYPANAAIVFMIDNFKAKLKEAIPESATLSAAELRKTVIVASIVEREYVSPDEAPLMASVFYNRLSRNKALESCATVVYVMTEEYKLPHPSRLFFRDLAKASPYNTYLHKGLPPGPISNPGITALKAAFAPQQSDYLYFVLKGPQAKRHYFSRTFAEHNSASVFYLKGQD